MAEFSNHNDPDTLLTSKEYLLKIRNCLYIVKVLDVTRIRHSKVYL